MTATPIGSEPAGQKAVQRREQDDERRTRHCGDTFRSDHEREHHDDLLTQADVMSGRRFCRLGDEDGGHREIERRAVEVKRVTGRHDEPDDVTRNAEALHRFHRLRQGGFTARGGEGERGRLAHGPDELAERHADEENDAPEDENDENDEREIERDDQIARD